ncbi:hypothetical protein CTheo_1173 [Ceratobasidium theobromae]|uniref:Ribosomal protein S21 n=1 Tax=Ceratobasidium theobromae TaxID=1582974 RepID=A0A5N5QUQ0_9AGAM|nr:hypothetical protein CTheo_1173 [Ceratobasidium theobromae]
MASFPLAHARLISGSGGIDKHFAPYPALPKPKPQSSNPPSLLSTPDSPPRPSDFFLNLTTEGFGATRVPDDRWASVHETLLREVVMKEPGNVYTGRSVPVTGGIDVSIAYRRLHGVLSRNRIRSELFLQRRYEKPSDRERRLKSERHRRRFAAWIRKKVQLVSEIRRRS